MNVICRIAPCNEADGKERQSIVIHEWGTFTCLQDEDGRALGGINSDDEPVPAFVYSLWPDLIVGGPSKGIPHCHPDVTMRLETPVIYVHLPPGRPKPVPIEISAEFRGGWITEYYPYAVSLIANTSMTTNPLSLHITDKTIGRINWSNLIAGVTSSTLPNTNDAVWLSPRQVQCDTLTITSTPLNVNSRYQAYPDDLSGVRESEKYLFYRGVGQVNSPLRVVTRPNDMKLMPQTNSVLKNGFKTPAAWLVKVNTSGRCAHRSLGQIEFDRQNESDISRVEHPEFAETEFTDGNLSELKFELRDALLREGLYADEAQALLNTWQVSYFQSPGTRLFFILPVEWADSVLPLHISQSAEIKRVMVGRIELISPEQQRLVKLITNSEKRGDEEQGRKAYTALGRFRDTLVLDEQEHRPSEALERFVERMQLLPSSPQK